MLQRCVRSRIVQEAISVLTIAPTASDRVVIIDATRSNRTQQTRDRYDPVRKMKFRFSEWAVVDRPRRSKPFAHAGPKT